MSGERERLREALAPEQEAKLRVSVEALRDLGDDDFSLHWGNGPLMSLFATLDAERALAHDRPSGSVGLRVIVARVATMGSCSQTHHEYLARDARAALSGSSDPHPLVVKDGIGTCQTCGAQGLVGSSDPERGTVTECPLKGVHEHVFRGPHGFREWVGSSDPEAVETTDEFLAGLRRLRGSGSGSSDSQTEDLLAALAERGIYSRGDLDTIDAVWRTLDLTSADQQRGAAKLRDALAVRLTEAKPETPA